DLHDQGEGRSGPREDHAHVSTSVEPVLHLHHDHHHRLLHHEHLGTTSGEQPLVHHHGRHDELRRGWFLDPRISAVLRRDLLRHRLHGVARQPWHLLSVHRRRRWQRRPAWRHPGRSHLLPQHRPGNTLVASNGTNTNRDCT